MPKVVNLADAGSKPVIHPNFEEYMRFNKYNKSKENKPPTGGLTVEVRDGNIEGAIRIMKKKLQNDNFFDELRSRTYFESKGTKRREAKKAATRRSKRNIEKTKEKRDY
jgi:small subunit ribosomal protein S21|tara:strand:- start:868 stop:1194 length:327 start_codon:yes stop_codon:yes gene_type:complete